MGDAVLTDDAGLCLRADLTGEIPRGGGTCLSFSFTIPGEKWADRDGLADMSLPLLAVLPFRGTSRLAVRS